MVLHSQIIVAADAAPRQAVVFLHGILGSGANLRAHAKRLVAEFPWWMAVLVDLRGHGNSRAQGGEDTVSQAARDVLETTAALPVPLRAAVGHSFGGKVALELARIAPALSTVVTLDSAPGLRVDFRGSEAIAQVLNALGAIAGPWASRGAFVRALVAQGLAEPLGQWLAMNLRWTSEGFEFALDLKRISRLLDDYFALDCWPVLEATSTAGLRATHFHLVIADGSSVYAPEDRLRAQQLAAASQGAMTVEVLPGAHWIHAENPEAVAGVLRGQLGRDTAV